MSTTEVWIEAPDPRSAAFLMRRFVGAANASLHQCRSARWQVLVCLDVGRGQMLLVVETVSAWLESCGLERTTVHVGHHAFHVHRRSAA